MDATAVRRRVEEARVARLATADGNGKPHVVPVSFAIEDDTLFFAVDAKPKRTTNLKRLRNMAANPSVSLLIDHYEEDWSRLWWVRVDGRARVLTDEAQAQHAVDLLAGKYEQYRNARPSGRVVAVAIERISGWSPATELQDNPGR
jgi:PPOX class probable F420-dependent enzyme